MTMANLRGFDDRLKHMEIWVFIDKNLWKVVQNSYHLPPFGEQVSPQILSTGSRVAPVL